MLAPQIASLHVFFKQRAAQFFPAWAFCLPTTLLRVPYSLVEGIQWSCIVYWLAGLAPEAGRYGLMQRQIGTLLSDCWVVVLPWRWTAHPFAALLSTSTGLQGDC